jgi:hypothetical protein
VEKAVRIFLSWAYRLPNVEISNYRLGALIGYPVSSGKEKSS